MSVKSEIVMLMAEDDDDDFLLTKKALQQSHLLNRLDRVRDGDELMNYLTNTGEYADVKKYPRPGVVLLDLNMPRKDGREALREIKSNSAINDIPIVVFTTSKAEEDIYRSYKLGVNSFISKPVQFADLITVVDTLGKYWFEIVELPPALQED